MQISHRLGITLLLLSGVSQAASSSTDGARIAVDAEQIGILGITLGNPEPVSHVAGLSVSAHVTVPPEADRVVASTLAGAVTRLLKATGEPVTEGEAVAHLYSQELLGISREYLAALSGHGLARIELDRDRQLFDAGVIAERRLQETRARFESANAQLAEQGSLLRLAGLDQAALDRLGTTRELIAETVLRAPLDGVVTATYVSAGERVDANAPVYRIARHDRLWLEIRVPHEHAARIRIGDRLLVSSQRYAAAVLHVANFVDPEDQTVLVRAELETAPRDLLPGQFLTLQLQQAQQQAHRLPHTAVTQLDGKPGVFVRTADGFTLRAVTVLGHESSDVLLGGLTGNERIAITGIAALKAHWLGMGGGD